MRFVGDSLVLIAPLHHPWAERGEISPDQLVKGRFILREEGSGSYDAICKALNEVDISIYDLPTILTLGNSEAIALTVREGLGVGFVSEKVVEAFGMDGLAIVHIKGVEIKRDIYISRNKRHAASIPQATFWSYLYSPDNPFCLCENTKGDLAIDRGVYERN